MNSKIKKCILGCLMLTFLAGCGAGAKNSTNGGVEDIQPGQKSVITSPQPQSAPAGIEERNI